MGWTASERSASICSVTFIVPISAAIDAPTRPATMRPVSTGPRSRKSDTATTEPVADFMPSVEN